MLRLTIAAKQSSILVTVLLGLTLLGVYNLFNIRDVLDQDRRQELKHLGELASSQLGYFKGLEDKGLMTKEQAQKAAFDALRDVRFGNKDYLFAYDWSGVSRMLGPKPEFEGTNRIESKDTLGHAFIKELVEAAKKGGDFVPYMFPKAGETNPSPKLSYAAPFAPWEILIGTGFYIDDIDLAFQRFAKETGIVAGVVLLIMGLLVFFISRSITRPLSQITQAMNALAGGDKTVAIPHVERQDEIGAVARALLTFKEQAVKVDQLQSAQKESEAKTEQMRRKTLMDLADSFEQTIMGVVAGVSSAATEMQGSAKSLASTAEDTTSQSAAVDHAARGASSGVQTVATAAEELNASISEISRQTHETVQVSGECMAEADVTGQEMQALSKAAEDIESVVNLINTIASQVNLLALNATIEAARAGDAGKGFAVVAGEVKNLATQTGTATKEIASKIENIQSRTQSAVNSITRISETIRRTKDIATAVASAAEQQGAATAEISRSMQSTAADTNEVTRNIAGVREAAEETGRASMQLNDTAGQLAKEAETLRATVNNFIADIRKR